MLFLNRSAREARWYEEEGNLLHRDSDVAGMFALALCVIAFLGVPMLVGIIVETRRGTALRRKGEAMNREAGRPLLARSTRHLGGLSGGEYWVNQTPDEQDRPDDPELQDPPTWLKPFRRIYYLVWLVVVVGYIVAVNS